MTAKWTYIINTAILLGILIAINVIASYFRVSADLTEDKRFTLTPSTTKVLEQVDEPIYIKVLLEGKFPAGFKRLRNATEEMIQDMHSVNTEITYDFIDPNAGTSEERKGTYDQLREVGIAPMRLTYVENDQRVEALTFPFAIVSRGSANVVVNLLEEQVVGVDEEVTINNSVTLLEYKLANAIQKLQSDDIKTIVFVSGHGELEEKNTYRLEGELRRYYDTGRLDLDSTYMVPQDIDLLVVARPQTPYSDKDKFKLDQYVMNGGKVIWLIDHLDARLDSIAKYGVYSPSVVNHGLDDLFFKYGIRMEPNLIMDYSATMIPQVVGVVAEKPQMEMRPWYFHPLLTPTTEHPIAKNIAAVNPYFPSTVTVLETKPALETTVLLGSSNRSRFKFVPMQLSSSLTQVDADPKLFNKEAQPIAVLAEGQFTSMFKNRMTPSFLSMLEQIDQPFKDLSTPTAQLFVSDSDLIKNRVDQRSNRTTEIGQNRWTGQVYGGNKTFILNAVEYMVEEDHVLAARAKEVKLRLLDAAKTKTEKSKWQFLNLGLPLVLLALFGLVFTWWRRRKYA